MESGHLLSPPCVAAHSTRFGPAYSLSTKKGEDCSGSTRGCERTPGGRRAIPSRKRETGDLPLQALQSESVGSEFEDALFAGLGVARNPHFAGAGGIHRAYELPHVVAGNRVAGPKTEFHALAGAATVLQ